LLNVEAFNHQCELETGILKEQCGSILTEYFKSLRLMKREKKDE